MDSNAIEISIKIRAAVKAKLRELGLTHVDDDLPEYVMVLVAHKKSKEEMAKDLNLFLGKRASELFSTWIHDVLDKIRSITAKKDYGKEKDASDVSDAYEDSVASVAKHQRKKRKKKSSRKLSRDTDFATEAGESAEKMKKSHKHKKSKKSKSAKRKHRSCDRAADVAEITERELLSNDHVRDPPPKRSRHSPIRAPTPSSDLRERLLWRRRSRSGSRQRSYRQPPTIVVRPLQRVWSSPSENFTPVISVCENESRDASNELMQSCVLSTPLSVLDSPSFMAAESAKQNFTEGAMKTSVKNTSMPVMQASVTATPCMSCACCTKEREHVDGTVSSSETHSSESSIEQAALTPKYVTPVVAPLEINLDSDDDDDAGEEQSNCTAALVTRTVSASISVVSTDETPLSSPKEKIMERCRYWPSCRSGTACLYYHPISVCKAFPSCKQGEKCLFVHPKCKFDAHCINPQCVFTHTTTNRPTTTSGSSHFAFGATRCRYGDACRNTRCPFLHTKVCKFGTACSRPDCRFQHPQGRQA